MAGGRDMSFKEYAEKYLNKPFKFNNIQKVFIEKTIKEPHRKLIIATRGQLSRMRG